MTNHTQGEWVLDDPIDKNPQRAMGGEQVFKVVGYGFGGGLIADVSSWWYDRETAKANACLIAAAPDMLVELEQALSCLRQYRDYGEAMRSIGRGFQATDTVGRTIDSVIAGIESAIAKANGE